MQQVMVGENIQLNYLHNLVQVMKGMYSVIAIEQYVDQGGQSNRA